MAEEKRALMERIMSVVTDAGSIVEALKVMNQKKELVGKCCRSMEDYLTLDLLIKEYVFI